MSPRQTIRATQVAGGESIDGDGGEKKVKATQLEGNVALGDLIWVKLRGGSWWPAQVFDENTLSKTSKPGYRPAQAVLVRLYGSYECLYVDPIKCHSKFEMILCSKVLKQNNGCCREIFEKSLEQELLQLKSGRPKRKASASADCIHKKPKSNKPNAKEEEKSRTHRKDGTQKTTKPNNTSDEERSTSSCIGEEDKKNKTPKQNEGTSLSKKAQELSARRLRVMQSLGLVAPSGSPFGKGKQICTST
ncbi:hypothetical protein Ddye_006432 [Dipteronia dyeriana]|uniref:PWWP domain-containing protein n=1 Tax=Dipteronia dyeriana TaxID=168575 RepID=A0AAD9XI69_9ROSI|nr:hypothetical protein Ddye_006432 [Dipteronia dyeriana]